MLEQLERQLPGNRDKQRIALVDGDIIKYRVGFASETMLYRLYLTEKPEGYEGEVDRNIPLEFEGKRALNEFIAKYELDPDFLYWEELLVPDTVDKCLHSVKLTIERIQNATQADKIVIYLSGKENYRDELATIKDYKGNRKDARKPWHYQEIHDYLVKYWDAQITEGIEADDAMGISQMRDWMKQSAQGEDELAKSCRTVIVTLDKDLDMIPGWHFNWVAEDPESKIPGYHYWVTEWEALQHFFAQVLAGDDVDNIPGIRGIGMKKAMKALDGCETTQQMYDVCVDMYMNWIETLEEVNGLIEDEAKKRMDEAAALVWILRSQSEKGFIPYYYNMWMNVTPRENNNDKEDTSVSGTPEVDGS